VITRLAKWIWEISKKEKDVMDRRELLKNSLLMALGGLGLSSRNGGAMVGRKIENICLQLYTVRTELEKDFERTLEQVAKIGYREVEFFDYYGRSPRQIRAALDGLNLKSPSSHADVPALTQELARTIDAVKEVGNQYLVCVYLAPEERQSLDDYKRFGELFNKVGETCKSAGIQFAYHNHDFEFQPMDGKVPFQVLLEETDSSLVQIEIDLYWITKAGAEPFEYFEAYPGRFPLFHVKDMDDTPKGFFTEVGRGVIDFPKIFERADQAGVKHFIVEQDETPGSPFESARISFEYLQALEY
jgi:sugar phosphate isomerase/epimerase